MFSRLKRLALATPVLREHIRRVWHAQETIGSLSSRLGDLSAAHEALLAAKLPVGIFRPPVALSELDPSERELVDRFGDLYYSLGQKGRATYILSWLGFPLLKCPLDLWIYQELICAIRPKTIIETGTASGGSALFLATICELLGRGQVISIDIEDRPPGIRPHHPRITYLRGSSTDHEIIAQVRNQTDSEGAGIVILDSDHRKAHVLEELNVYESFVPIGGYLIVEDTNINGHPTYPDFGPGPMEALEDFLARNDSFRSDPACERFLLTMNPRGFLTRHK